MAEEAMSVSTYEAGCIALLLQDAGKRGFILGESARAPVPLQGPVSIAGVHACGAERRHLLTLGGSRRAMAGPTRGRCAMLGIVFGCHNGRRGATSIR